MAMLNSLTEHFFTINQCYKFVTILEVLMDRMETKSIKLIFYFEFIIVNNPSDFQKSERPIARTAKKLNNTLQITAIRQIRTFKHLLSVSIVTMVGLVSLVQSCLSLTSCLITTFCCLFKSSCLSFSCTSIFEIKKCKSSQNKPIF